MIYDVFLYHGEEDILEIRLNILDKVVDKFVICEARQTFVGDPCPLYYEANKERFKKWEDKIIYFPFNMMEDKELVELARTSPNTTGNPFWMKVFYAMEMMRKPLEVCKDDDIIFISDCDEIWNPKIEITKDDKVYGMRQRVYYYYLNNRCNEEWTGSVYTTYRRLKKEVLNYIKQKGEVKVDDGGWHFSYQGGEEQIKKKIRDSKESYYGVPTEYILQRVKENKDIFPDDYRPKYKFWTDESDLPEYFINNKEKYKHLFK